MTTAMAELPKIKSSIEAGYIILMIASTIDGEYTMPKGMKIVDFLVKYSNQDIDIDKINSTLLEVTSVRESIPLFFHSAIDIYYLLNDESEVIDLIGFVHSVMCADGKDICDSEKKVFNAMCKAFNQPDLAQLIN